MKSSTEYIFWQLADTSFPTGGFAHSSGLESGWRHGLVQRENIHDFCHDLIRQVSMQTGPFVDAASQNPSRIWSLDSLYHVMCANHVARRASILQGGAMLLAAQRAFGLEALKSLQESHCTGEFNGHFGPVFGAVCGLVHIEPLAAVRLLLFGTVRQTLSAAVRLGIMGSLESLPMLHAMTNLMDQAAESALNRLPEHAAMACPLVDICQSSHDRLYSRLFQS